MMVKEKEINERKKKKEMKDEKKRVEVEDIYCDA